MSNGARFVTTWGQAWRNAGYPVKAIWASHGTTAPSFDEPGQLTVPTVFSTPRTTSRSPPGGSSRASGRAQRRDALEFHMSQERRLTAPPYERIPGIDSNESKQIVAAMIATEVWNSQGDRIEPDIETAVAKAQSASLPASVQAQRNEIVNETALQMAVHQFTAEYAEQVIAFFTRYVP